ncbi:MAG: DinB family protein [Dehalococcoidia bacterium]
MQDISSDLNKTVETFYKKYKNTDDKKASIRPEPNEWSLKEVIGHLINSASLYHQRFVGLQTVNEMIFPEYQKHLLEWIGIEKFNDLSLADLLLLWKQYNILMGHIIETVNKEKLGNYLLSGDKKRTLESLITDYVRHLKDHLVQFEQTLAKVRK